MDGYYNKAYLKQKIKKQWLIIIKYPKICVLSMDYIDYTKYQ